MVKFTLNFRLQDKGVYYMFGTEMKAYLNNYMPVCQPHQEIARYMADARNQFLTIEERLLGKVISPEITFKDWQNYAYLVREIIEKWQAEYGVKIMTVSGDELENVLLPNIATQDMRHFYHYWMHAIVEAWCEKSFSSSLKPLEETIYCTDPSGEEKAVDVPAGMFKNVGVRDAGYTIEYIPEFDVKVIYTVKSRWLKRWKEHNGLELLRKLYAGELPLDIQHLSKVKEVIVQSHRFFAIYFRDVKDQPEFKLQLGIPISGMGKKWTHGTGSQFIRALGLFTHELDHVDFLTMFKGVPVSYFSAELRAYTKQMVKEVELRQEERVLEILFENFVSPYWTNLYGSSENRKLTYSEFDARKDLDGLFKKYNLGTDEFLFWSHALIGK